MARYRKVDPRIWNDEKFAVWDPIDRVVWFALLTHPAMTPMGAGVVSGALLDELAGNAGDFCFRCQDNCGSQRHRYMGILTPFLDTTKGGASVLVDGGLVILKNYLLYNCPEGPTNLVAWISACEELPRSERFADLLEHLHKELDGKPEWLFAGLLEPLARQQVRNLKDLFWERIAPYAEKPKGRPVKKGAIDAHQDTPPNLCSSSSNGSSSSKQK